MIKWFWIFSIGFILLLVFVSTKAIRRNKSIDDFMLAGSNIGAVLGVLTYAAALFSAFIFIGFPDFKIAALFSAFIFIGVPDFFRVHGIGA